MWPRTLRYEPEEHYKKKRTMTLQKTAVEHDPREKGDVNWCPRSYTGENEGTGGTMLAFNCFSWSNMAKQKKKKKKKERGHDRSIFTINEDCVDARHPRSFERENRYLKCSCFFPNTFYFYLLLFFIYLCVHDQRAVKREIRMKWNFALVTLVENWERGWQNVK